MEYFVYENNFSGDVPINDDLEIQIFKPLPWKLYFDKNIEKVSFRITLFRLYISLLSHGKTQIYFAIDKNTGRIIHQSCVIPRNFKYPFLKKNELCIGNCKTEPEFRGRGIYPYVIKQIMGNNPNTIFKMIIREDNISSINGVKKAGFELTKEKVRGSLILNRFVSVLKK